MHFNANYHLPSDCIISYKATDENAISFSQIAKDPSAPIVKNRAWTTLNVIKSGIDNRSTFIFEEDFGAEKISDVTQAIYARYETRYRESYLQSFIDLFTCCFGGKSDLEKMQDLLNEILKHKDVETDPLESTSSQSEDDFSLHSDSDESEIDTVSEGKPDSGKYDPFKHRQQSWWHQAHGENLENLKQSYWDTLFYLNQVHYRNEAEQSQLVEAIKATFKQVEHQRDDGHCGIRERIVFNKYALHILSHIVTLNKVEGTNPAMLHLELFIKALIRSDHENFNYYQRHLLSKSLVEEALLQAMHLDQQPLEKCCQHIPVTSNFRLTPLFLKILIAEYAKSQIKWDIFVLRHIRSEEEVIAVIEAAQELNDEQQDMLLSALYGVHCFYSTINMVQALFENRGLNPADYPPFIYPYREHYELFLPSSGKLKTT